MRWTTNKNQHAYMQQRRRENLERSANNPAEAWAWKELAAAIHDRCCKQYIFGCRILDFYYPGKRIAVEIDGKQHDRTRAYDNYRDNYNLLRSGIVVIRVRAFDNVSLRAAIKEIKGTLKWKSKKTSSTSRKRAVEDAGLKLAHGKWKPPSM